MSQRADGPGRMRLAGAALLVLFWLPATGAAQLPPPVIDMHLHSSAANSQGPPPVGICPGMAPFRSASSGSAWGAEFGATTAEPPCSDPIWSPETDDELMEATVAILERRNVFGVTSGPRLNTWDERVGHRIIRGTQRYLDLRPAPPIDVLRERIEAGEIEVFAEVTIQYSGIEPTDPEFAPFVALAEEMDIPMGIHVGPGPPGAPYLWAPDYRGRLHSPLLYEDLLIRHPDLRLYLMHAGWPMLDDLLALMWTHPQVYVGLGMISWALPDAEFHRYLRTIVQAGFGERVMFGSDNMVWPGTIEFAIERIESADYLAERQKRDILYNNAARFLRLTDDEIAAHHGR